MVSTLDEEAECFGVPLLVPGDRRQRPLDLRGEIFVIQLLAQGERLLVLSSRTGQVSLSEKSVSPLASLASRVIPAMYSVTRKSTPFWVPNSCTVAILGWLRRARDKASLRNCLCAESSAKGTGEQDFYGNISAVYHAHAAGADLLHDPVV